MSLIYTYAPKVGLLCRPSVSTSDRSLEWMLSYLKVKEGASVRILAYMSHHLMSYVTSSHVSQDTSAAECHKGSRSCRNE